MHPRNKNKNLQKLINKKKVEHTNCYKVIFNFYYLFFIWYLMCVDAVVLNILLKQQPKQIKARLIGYRGHLS